MVFRVHFLTHNHVVALDSAYSNVCAGDIFVRCSLVVTKTGSQVLLLLLNCVWLSGFELALCFSTFVIFCGFCVPFND